MWKQTSCVHSNTVSLWKPWDDNECNTFACAGACVRPCTAAHGRTKCAARVCADSLYSCNGFDLPSVRRPRPTGDLARWIAAVRLLQEPGEVGLLSIIKLNPVYWQTDWQNNTEGEVASNYRRGLSGWFCDCIGGELGGIGFSGI